MDSIDEPYTYIYLVNSLETSESSIGVINISNSSLDILNAYHGYQVNVEDSTINEVEARNLISSSNMGNINIIRSTLRTFLTDKRHRAFVKNSTIEQLVVNNSGFDSGSSRTINNRNIDLENCSIGQLDARNSNLNVSTVNFVNMKIANSTVRIDGQAVGTKIQVTNGSQFLIMHSTLHVLSIRVQQSDVIMEHSVFSVNSTQELFDMESDLNNYLRVENWTFSRGQLPIPKNRRSSVVFLSFLRLKNISDVILNKSNFTDEETGRYYNGIIMFSRGGSINVTRCFFKTKTTHLYFWDGEFRLSTSLCKFMRGNYTLFSGMYGFLDEAVQQGVITTYAANVCHIDTHNETDHPLQCVDRFDNRSDQTLQSSQAPIPENRDVATGDEGGGMTYPEMIMLFSFIIVSLIITIALIVYYIYQCRRKIYITQQKERKIMMHYYSMIISLTIILPWKCCVNLKKSTS